MKMSRKGLTLVEMLVVVVVLAILAAFLIPALNAEHKRAMEKKEQQATQWVSREKGEIIQLSYVEGTPLSLIVKGENTTYTIDVITDNPNGPKTPNNLARYLKVGDIVSFPTINNTDVTELGQIGKKIFDNNGLGVIGANSLVIENKKPEASGKL